MLEKLNIVKTLPFVLRKVGKSVNKKKLPFSFKLCAIVK